MVGAEEELQAEVEKLRRDLVKTQLELKEVLEKRGENLLGDP